ncbi:MAG: hypothetical protein HGB02_08570 [Chlorobiaceae bacterium]|nr:hypothetical protein [Chlorobiaceae bacterium]
MANLTPNPLIFSDVYQLETTDPVLGGPGGVANRQPQELLNRTAYIKALVDDLIADLGDLDAYAKLASPTFTGSPAAPTPAQFDNDTSIATTAFVQRAIGNYRSYIGISGDNSLSAADGGGLYEITGSGTTTLPSAVSRQGLCFTLSNTSAVAVALASAGGNFYGGGVSGSSSFSVPSGVSVKCVSDGGNWKVINNVGPFSLGTSGYQKLPSGLIFQFAKVTVTGGAATFNWPMTFPNFCVGLGAFYQAPSDSGYNWCQGNNLSAAQYRITIRNAAQDLAESVAFAFGIGY